MLANLSKEEDMEFLQTLIEEQHFPFYEFLWLCMLGLWWSVINRLNRIENRLIRRDEDIDFIMEEIGG